MESIIRSDLIHNALMKRSFEAELLRLKAISVKRSILSRWRNTAGISYEGRKSTHDEDV